MSSDKKNVWLCGIWIAMPVGALAIAAAIEHPWSVLLIVAWVFIAYLAAEAVVRADRP